MNRNGRFIFCVTLIAAEYTPETTGGNSAVDAVTRSEKAL
jgi:hypothetical protein